MMTKITSFTESSFSSSMTSVQYQGHCEGSIPILMNTGQGRANGRVAL
jgi:hypothetical protein